MKKIFSKIETRSRGNTLTSLPEPIDKTVINPNIGKIFTVGRNILTVEDVIAEGGFAIVFLVKNAQGLKWALKRLFVNNEKDLTIAKREISIVSNLNGHKNLIGYIDSSITLLDGGVYEVLLVMPYHKTHLLQLLNERLSSGFNEAEILDIFNDVCEAIARLHYCQTPIIHRDIKVENILKSTDNHYILCDFGSATTKILNREKQGLTPVEEEIKKYTTLAYRSPEMVDLYSNVPLTTKLDIWALGCLLYKLCFFTLPFGESALAIQSGSLTFPKKNKYSENLLKLIRYCLTPDANSRPDIFQVFYLSCQLSNRKCTLENLHNVPHPKFEDILLSEHLPSASKDTADGESVSVVEVKDESSSLVKNGCIETATSVAPRQRPKPKMTSNSGPLVPLTPSKSSSKVYSNPFTNSSKDLFPSNFDIPSGTETNSKYSEETHRVPSNPFVSNVNHWNPFSESKNVTHLSEDDVLFGVEFDQIRIDTNTSVQESKKNDPFDSAPFSAKN